MLGQPEVELPEGLYWFQGVDGGALILQVCLGAAPGDATVAPLDQLGDDHPLMAAFGWAEKQHRGHGHPSVPRVKSRVERITVDPAVCHGQPVVRDGARGASGQPANPKRSPGY